MAAPAAMFAPWRRQALQDRWRVVGGLMALGGASLFLTRATVGRPHRFHDVLLLTELATPVVVELAARAAAGSTRSRA